MYRQDLGVAVEQRWVNQDVWRRGDPLKGSVKIDLFDKKTRDAYDLKFVLNPGKGLKPKQIRKIQQQIGADAKVIEVNPNPKYIKR